MKCLRIVLTQSSANFRKNETVKNKMTYPLPPFHTVIGALHSACNYTALHHMDVSIAGRFGAVNKRYKIEHLAYNSVGVAQRGTLVRYVSQDISNAYIVIAKAIPRTNSNFFTGKNIRIVNKKEYDVFLKQYNCLEKQKKERLALSNSYDERIKKAKTADEAKLLRKEKSQKRKEFKIPELQETFFNTYRAVTPSPTYIEMLEDIELVIHIRSDEDTLSDIYNNVYNIKSIGRSEDFINVTDAKFVDLFQEKRDSYDNLAHYISTEACRNKNVVKINGDAIQGTKHCLNKEYEIVDGKRIFSKIPCVYCSNIKINDFGNNIYVDENGYIVNFC